MGRFSLTDSKLISKLHTAYRCLYCTYSSFFVFLILYCYCYCKVDELSSSDDSSRSCKVFILSLFRILYFLPPGASIRLGLFIVDPLWNPLRSCALNNHRNRRQNRLQPSKLPVQAKQRMSARLKTRQKGEEMNRAIRAIFPFDVARNTCWGGACLQPRFFVGRID